MGSGNSRTDRKVRYAVVGLGHIAQVAVLPAFAHARQNSELAALVSGSAKKRRALSRRYRVTAYGYHDYDALLETGLVDAVYLALPNHLHCEYAVRAARAGIHVLCEKPMAVSERECRRMLEAAEDGGVKLMIAYRLHFEGANLSAMQLARSGRLGEVRLFQSTFSMQVKPGNVRLVQEGGGPLYDIGIYCINAARYVFGAEPDAVSAMCLGGRDARFREVEEAVSAILHFPGQRIAAFTCSFGATDVSSYRIIGTEADLHVEPAYEYAEGLAYTLTRQGRKTRRGFPKRDQFAPELLHFSRCIREGKRPEPSGEEGLIDVQIINALHRAAASGRRVELATRERRRRPAPEQERRLPPVRKPRLVRVESASA
jgi:glucose-fructose oxidoreductase